MGLPAGMGSYAACRQRQVRGQMIEFAACANRIDEGNWCCCSNPLPGEITLDPEFSSPGQGGGAPDGKLSPDAPPSAPLLAPREGPAWRSSANPAGLAPLLPLAEQPYATGFYRSWSNFLTRRSSKTPWNSSGAQRAWNASKPAAGIPRRSACCSSLCSAATTANSKRLRSGQPSSQAPLAGPGDWQGQLPVRFQPLRLIFAQACCGWRRRQGNSGDLWGGAAIAGAQLIHDPSHWPPGWAAEGRVQSAHGGRWEVGRWCP